jgi:hypothetical protein
MTMPDQTTPVTIGSPAWILDPQRRSYERPDGTRSGGPLRSAMWRDAVIVAETSRSWIIVPIVLADVAQAWQQMSARWTHRVPKSAEGIHMGTTVHRQAVEDDIFVHDHRARIVDAVQRAGAAQLRDVAAAVGYPVPE